MDAALERLSLRQTDPISGERYHVNLHPPKTRGVKDRLKTHPNDRDLDLRRRLAHYQMHVEEIHDHYGKQVMHINSEQEAHSVFELIESFIIHPIITC